MGPPHAHLKPLHKSLLFRALMVLTVTFMAISLLVFAHISEPEDDDLVLRATGGMVDQKELLDLEHQHKHKHHKHHHHNRHSDEIESTSVPTESPTSSSLDKLNADLIDLYDGQEPQEAIRKFHQDQQQAQKQRRLQGLVTPRERFEQEQFDPDDWERIVKAVNASRQVAIPTQSQEQQLPYDIHNCPLDPPSSQHYPFTWNVMTLLENWNPDDTEILPTSIYQSVCVFDWNQEGDQKKAHNYRQQEVPFVIQNMPEPLRTAERWSTPGYLEDLLGQEQFVTEHSRNNHFLFWNTQPPHKTSSQNEQEQPSDFVPPTDMVNMTYAEWLEKANELEKERRRSTRKDHWYLRVNAMLHNHAYLYEELPFFDPTLGKALTMVEPTQHRGINCRFGMKETIAEAHYDSYNNFIAILGGRRRFILAHPDQCENLELYPMGHPSARHSRVNWSNAYLNWRDSERPFAQAQVNELLLQAGDILYLPTFWFHFIVSLSSTTYQCNSRSGVSLKYEHHISKCGFGPRREYQRKDLLE